MLTYSDAIAEVMWHLITHESHGYSQYHREGDGTTETLVLSDGSVVYAHGGDYDCSEAVRSCVAAVGLIPFGYWDSYMWTGNEPDILTGAGFVEISPYDVGVGDILLRYSGHTEVVLGGWEGELYQGGFRIAETGGIDGETGDQTGWESTYSALSPGSWDVAFRYAGPERGGASPSPSPIIDESEEIMECIFQPNEESYLMYYDGVELHPLHHPDEAEAIRMVYRETHGGREMPSFKLGSPAAPWATRFVNAVQRKCGPDMFPVMA